MIVGLHFLAKNGLALDRLHIEHLVGVAKAVVFVKSTAGIGGVQRDDADPAAAGLGQGKLNEMAGDVLSPMGRIDVDVQ